MTPTDRAVIILIVVLSLVGVAANSLLPAFRQEAAHAVVRVGGEVVRNIDLTDKSVHHKIQIEGPLGVSVLQVQDGNLRMISSPCPDKLCIKQGWVHKPGAALVCVPNEISVAVEGEQEVDAIIK